jgi:hypothetical protein
LSITLIKPSLTAGELSPSVWGRVDYAKWHIGASVMRNMFVRYTGGSSSRAGLSWCGKSLTPASASSKPPRIIRFQFNIFQSYLLEFGEDAQSGGRPYMRVIANGAYVTEASIPVTGATQAYPCVISAVNTYSNGDWVFGANFGGMTQLNGRTFILSGVTGAGFTLNDLFGNPVNSLGYSAFGSGSGGGSFARIYTNYDLPYRLEDLKYLKVVQSADLMTLCCVNQQTGTEYPPADLRRLAANNWQFDVTSFTASIAVPANATAVATVASTLPALPTQYAYVVTAISAATGEESVASNVAYIVDSADIALVSGSHIVSWSPVTGAGSYNVYQAPPAYDTAVPVGSVFAYVGSSFGTQFVNSNIIADQTRTPPLHLNPFARGAVIGATANAGGAAYVQATTAATMVSGTGSGAVLAPVVVSGAVVAIIVENGGEGYLSTDTILITGAGAGAAFTPQIGPQTGTYPSVPDYFQSRRVYAATSNNPDTLFLSQTGAYTNMDSAVPPIDSDAIVTTPWGQQVNGIQWLQPMPGGLIVMTGLDAWQITGAGGPGSALTPASQSAVQQESNGFSPTLKPLKINSDILYTQSLGYVVRDIQYNFINNIYGGNDISVLSNQLFDGFEINQWAWAQVPSKVVWATRNDGRFLSLTFDKEEALQGWARHDTNGLVVGNEVATEPPVNAPYFVVKRFIRGYQQWAYFIERMDNRLWRGPEDPWCVDAGLSLDQPAPEATLTAQAAAGPGTITGGYVATTGTGYSDPAAQIFDPLGTGSGAEITFTQTAGEIDGFTIVSPGENYSPGTTVTIIDPTGAGATFLPFVSQNVLFDVSAPVFGDAAAGDVIRIGGGQAVVTTVNNPSQVLAAIRVPISDVIPNDPYRLPVPAESGEWTITTPVTSVTGLDHLEGMQVTGLADGAVIPLTTVVNGAIDLVNPASAVVVGLPFLPQLQAMGIEMSSLGSIQGDRKLASGCTVRMEKSKGFQVGANQPVASALDFQREIPWDHLVDIPEVPRDDVPDAALPLFTGDKWVNLNDDWHNYNGWEAAPGMLAVQQSAPLPMNILAFVPKVNLGDNAGKKG